MRLRTILMVAAASLALCGCTIGRSTHQPTAATVPPPIVGQPVMLDQSVPGWATWAWLAEDALCVRSARTGEHDLGDADDFVFCDPIPPGLAGTGPPLLPTKPLPYVAPPDPQQREFILVGTVRGEVTDVSVTMFGRTATGAVHSLPVMGGRQVGAYAVWLPSSEPGGVGMNLDDITAVVARDAAGDVVAQLP